VYFSTHLSKMRLLGAALSNLNRDGSLAWMHVGRNAMERTGASEEDCEGLVNYALAIEGIEVALFFRELPDSRYRVSLRSKGAIALAVRPMSSPCSLSADSSSLPDCKSSGWSVAMNRATRRLHAKCYCGTTGLPLCFSDIPGSRNRRCCTGE
jgi:hypothetical protein